MKAGLDTSVVLRLLIGEPADQVAIAAKYVHRMAAEGSPALVSDLVVSEAYFALQYHYRVPKSEALAALKTLLASGDVEGSGVAQHVLASRDLASAQPGFVDQVIYRQYMEFVDEVATFEKAGRRLPGMRVLET